MPNTIEDIQRRCEAKGWGFQSECKINRETLTLHHFRITTKTSRMEYVFTHATYHEGRKQTYINFTRRYDPATFGVSCASKEVKKAKDILNQITT